MTLRGFHFTPKQRLIMEVVLTMADNGELSSYDDLIEKLPYKTTKQSLHFSIRALVKHGLLVLKDGGKVVETPSGIRRRSAIIPTLLAYTMVRGTAVDVGSFYN